MKDEFWPLTNEPTMNGEYLGHHELLVDATADTHVCPKNFAMHVQIEFPSGRDIRDKESDREMK